MFFENDNACLKLYKESIQGKIQDFIISFNTEQTSIDNVVQETLDLFEHLIKSYDVHSIRVRLTAKVCFIHFNSLTDEAEERFYHFHSFGYEYVFDTQDFYRRHMQRIAERLENFHVNGSNLMIKNISHIHICLA